LTGDHAASVTRILDSTVGVGIAVDSRVGIGVSIGSGVGVAIDKGVTLGLGVAITVGSEVGVAAAVQATAMNERNMTERQSVDSLTRSAARKAAPAQQGESKQTGPHATILLFGIRLYYNTIFLSSPSQRSGLSRHPRPIYRPGVKTNHDVDDPFVVPAKAGTHIGRDPCWRSSGLKKGTTGFRPTPE